jgi:RNA polymerase sigma-70 factor (ECF subfamily)
MSTRSADSDEINQALVKIAAGDQDAWGKLWERHRQWLWRMVELRMDQRLRNRINASDVIQEAYLEANDRLPEFLRERKMPFRLWLRFLVGQRLLILHRHHLGTRKRDAAREGHLESSTANLADVLMAQGKSPSEVAAQDELRSYLCDALDAMDATDREVLVLRHFEQLSNAEVAELLEIEPPAASKRYVRALSRLQEILAQRPDVFGD